MLTINNAQAFDEINGNKIVLLTSAERKALNDSKQYESVTEQRAEYACKLIGKSLKSFTYREVKQDYFLDKSFKDFKLYGSILIKIFEVKVSEIKTLQINVTWKQDRMLREFFGVDD